MANGRARPRNADECLCSRLQVGFAFPKSARQAAEAVG